MNAQIRVRPRLPAPQVPEPLEEPALEGQAPEQGPPALRTGHLDVRVRGDGGEQGAGKRDLHILLALAAVSLVVCVFASNPVAVGLALGVAGACGVDLIYRIARGVAAEQRRLRAALTCPYCRDVLPEDVAMACDRKGCGTLYHEECWEECRHTYGGCAIYGCGSSAAHLIGRFALQRRLLRLLVAAALFPPKFVKRLRENDQEKLGDVWRRSRAVQARISQNPFETLLVGVVNFVVTCALLVCAGLLLGHKPQGLEIAAFAVAIVALPILLMRFPLASHFAWFASKLIAGVFRAELAALSRADEGTFLARLAGYSGKKA